MRIVDLLKKEAVVLNAEVSTKEQMLDLLVDLHKEVGNIKDKAAFKAGIMKRESEGPTAIAEGICIPHSKNEAVINPGIAAITVPSGVDCAALDGEPSNLFFMIAAPAEGSDVHLEALSRLSTILMDPVYFAGGRCGCGSEAGGLYLSVQRAVRGCGCLQAGGGSDGSHGKRCGRCRLSDGKCGNRNDR